MQYMQPLYGAALWTRGPIEQEWMLLHKRSALRVIFAFCMVSTDAAVVIAGIMPLTLVVDIERKQYDTKGGEDLLKSVQIAEDDMDKWQQDCVNSNTRRWTYRLIPNIGE